MKNCLIVAHIILSALTSFGQQDHGIKLLGKVRGQSIFLRWAPTDEQTWILGNQKGYYVERFLIFKKNEAVKAPKGLLLTTSPLKPKPLQQWKNDVEKNDFSGIAAQAIYGSSFQVALPQSGSFTEITNRSKEQEQRFLFALFAADHSFQTANLSGLAFVDSTAKKDEKYLYRIYLAGQPPKIEYDTGLCYVGLQDITELAPPVNLTAHFADRVVLLRWPKSFVQYAYTSFVVERSANGIEFTRRNSSPYVNATSESEHSIYYQMLDSLPENGTEYYYRIRGITPFGETGPESERISGKGFRTLDARANIDRAIQQKGKVFIEWQIIGNHKAITGHYVERAGDGGKTFHALHEKPLAVGTVSFVDEFPESSNYYRVKTLGENGQISISFPVLVQLPDSVPPTQPKELKAKVDTTGLTRLSWSNNRERDLIGYKVYRSNFLNSEFSEINRSVQIDTSYVDSINVKTLTSRIYYKIAAFDKRMNRSLYSDVVMAKLPDVIPPLPPVFREIRPESNGIFIAWTLSSSDDIDSYILERRPIDSLQWKIIKLFNPKDSFYLDRSVHSKRIYQYRLLSIDKNKTQSIPSNFVCGTASDKNVRLGLRDISVNVDRESKGISLVWKDGEKRTRYLIFRGIGNGPLTLYKSIPSEASIFVDTNVELNTSYRYRIKCFHRDGRESDFSEELKIQY